MSLRDKFYRIAYFLLRVYCRVFCFAPYACVDAVIRKDGKVLLINQADGLGLGFPGGIVGYGESLEQALKREVLEETGFRVKVKRQLGAVSLTPARAGVNNVVVVFEAVIVGGGLKSSKEGMAGFYDLDKADLNADARVILKKFLKF